jgi:hypothetical protein
MAHAVCAMREVRAGSVEEMAAVDVQRLSRDGPREV